MEKWSLLKKSAILFLLGVIVSYLLGFSDTETSVINAAENTAIDAVETTAIETAETLPADPQNLIRFHVVANSDSKEDQAIKLAVRDAILKKVSPVLASSQSLDESRRLLLELRPEMEKIANGVVKGWGLTQEVTTDYGTFSFPTKSYGSLVLPAGEYEAVRILIGKAEGSNWWCVLFPPLCFVDIDRSTAVPVDGKPGIPIGETQKTQAAEQSQSTKTVKFYFWEKIKKITQL